MCLCRNLYEKVKVQLLGMDDIQKPSPEGSKAITKKSSAEHVLKSLSAWNWDD